MGVVEDLVRARADFERGDWATALDSWSGLPPDRLGADDLWAAGVTAYLVGRREVAVDRHQRAFRLREDAGDRAGAIRSAFHLSMLFATGSEPALAAGWTARAGRLLAELDREVVEAGYVSFLRMHAHLHSQDWPAALTAATETVEVARRHGDQDLLALALSAQGRLSIYAGEVAPGLTLLDEAMAGLTAGEVSPMIFGIVFCVAIEGCQEILDLGRVAEWTSALHRWCSAQPGLVAYTGQCSVHRGQVMRSRGAWAEALEEFALAIDRYRAAGALEAAGLAECERGDLFRLRGEYATAEEAYQRAGEHGYDPQPGLALLWLARGSARAALGAIRRLVGEGHDPVHRARLLPGAVEVLSAAGTGDEARAAADELERVASHLGTSALLARASYASAGVELQAGDPSGALPYLRKAQQVWAGLDSPVEIARVKVLVGRALAALGDGESARREWAAARETFRTVDARPAITELDRLLGSAEPPGGLTAREVQVLRLVAAGRSNGQIARELVLSEKTVARHLSNIFGKLDVGSRTAAAAFAFEHDIV